MTVSDYYWFFVFALAVGFVAGVVVTLLFKMAAGYITFRFKGGKH